ncbi:transcriptional regulator, TetR family [Rhodococcus rhodochrous J3]|uniref:TetR/AcrR family transcriptional regulator n=2 Tax=Rhodococcus rhodochrous TaxID=1829 RepID=A0AA46WVM3_RHORH|nr:MULTISPECIES: TetR/AcrR family transcriptional regulator [Rhodococcus]MCB8910392.1 TetR/AcrR family transcriptional regulator [Rhodococcus rhodochrous]MDC3728580.1 TetR/AcrR family transcriptional regulator [Rhodococcus sp. Rp3]MDJ0398416.1 helix-turn-helix domain-containing protein [Rhodococcus rhodochrous]MDO1486261.1 TetR/AcrR family transcriptional regulator [Rhodococcus rhodochrous]UZF44594.1 TetR/AcrR family transcriptional regulator [Rhodococcus rhodochrous]
MLSQRAYDTLLARGEDRRELILSVAQRFLARNGWRSTSLAQIAREAGLTPAGLLHHFESKDQLLHAVLDARDNDDNARVDRTGDLVEQLRKLPKRFEESPELVGMYAVLLIENLEPDAPLHDRLLGRYQAALDAVEAGIRRGQHAGRYRTDVDPAVKAVEIVAFLNGMETSWLLDRSLPLTAIFEDYIQSLEQQLMPAATS